MESTSINYAMHAVKSGAGGPSSPTESLSEMESEQRSATAGTSVWPSEMRADGLPQEQKRFYTDGHNKAFCDNKLAVCINNADAILAKYFRAVSEKNKRPLSQESFKIEVSKAFEE